MPTDIEVPHLAWPFQYDPVGRCFRVVEQDSIEDVQQSVQSYLATAKGDRPLSPDFGLDDPTFSAGIDAPRLAAEIMDSEDGRADVTVVATGPDAYGRQSVTVTVDLAE